MLREVIKTIFCSSFVWTGGMIWTQDALGADTVVYALQAGNDALGTLDLNTGVFTQISAQAVNDYELGVYGGILYGASNQCGCLFQLNPPTAAPTFAPIPFGNGNGFGALNGFGSTTAGLFVVGAAFGGLDALWSVSPASGATTLIGSTGVTTGGGTGFLSASSDSGQLYWEVQNGCTDTLYSLNTSTGAATMIGTAAACSPSKTGNPFSMVFTGGTLWANFYSDGFGTISTSTGAQTLVSTSAFPSFFGLAPYPLTPVINAGGVVSADQFGEFPSAAPGSWIEIFGTNLAVDARLWTGSDFNGANAPTSLDGTSVMIGGVPAFVEYISPTQVNVQVPNVAAGPQPLVLMTGAGSGVAYTLTIEAVDPGLLAPLNFKVNGTQYLVAFDGSNYVAPVGAIAGVTSAPAQPGDVIVMYGVGFGPVSPAIPEGQIVQAQNALPSFSISIGGAPATVQYAGLAPNYVGLYQFNVVVPAIAASNAAPVTFTVNGTAGMQTLYLAIN